MFLRIRTGVVASIINMIDHDFRLGFHRIYCF